MKNYALLNENNIVVNVSVADDNWDSTGWIEYTNDNPACIDGDYVDGYFYSIQPFASWLRNKGQWIPPIEYPKDGKFYTWDEELGDWVETLAE